MAGTTSADHHDGGVRVRPLPPRFRAAAEKNRLHQRRAQERMSEERKVRNTITRPGGRRDLARRLGDLMRQGGAKKRIGEGARAVLFKQVYGHLDANTRWQEAIFCAALAVAIVTLARLDQIAADSGFAAVNLELSDAGDATAKTTKIPGAAAASAAFGNGCLYFATSVVPCLLALVLLFRVLRLLWRFFLYKEERRKLKEAETTGEHLCAICFDPAEADNERGASFLAADDEDVIKLSCGHRFHGDCVKPWLALRRCCPICRTSVAA
eukprot:TRINITY_DN18164_c0_g1_i1.p2 TRINITY_DN18164_c0_g1~~TRINITY_DN18164_c0_g1_i1.p2  ORF type:complete len:268 (+),score=60.12 TRINITY_DN18164_c0_g1_i1:98-901(+)